MNVLIADDHVIFRDMLKEIVSVLFPAATLASAENGSSAVRHLNSQVFTHLLVDLDLPDLDGFDIVDMALGVSPNIHVIALTSHCNEYAVYRVEKRRIRGLIDKRAVTSLDIRQAMASILTNRVYFSPSFLLLRSERMKNPQSFDKILSDRELAVLALIAAPFNDHEIATELKISPETVEKHRFNLLRKLNLRSTAELARYARRNGIVRWVAEIGRA